MAASPLAPPLRWRGANTGRGATRGARAVAAPSPSLPHLPRGALAFAGGLRLGFISSDLGDHPVGHALLPWLGLGVGLGLGSGLGLGLGPGLGLGLGLGIGVCLPAP